MSNDFYGYSVTAASNTSNFPENQAPSTVNDGGRAFQAAAAAYRNQLDGTCTVGGTSDAITLTYSPTFSSIVQNQIHTFIAGATNTTTTPTLSIDGLTARTIVRDNNGTALVAGDIQQYRTYHVRYDLANTRYVLLNPSSYYVTGSVDQTAIGASAVGQGELKSTTASQSRTNQGDITPTGDTYTLSYYVGDNGTRSGTVYMGIHTGTYAATVNISGSIGVTGTFYLYSRYIQASPPYNFGIGDVAVFIMAMIERSTGNVLGTYVAEDPPWAYHGSHDLHPINGKLKKHFGVWGANYRQMMANPATRDQFMQNLADMRAAKSDPRQLQQILSEPFTMAEKMRDMNAVPHLFSDFDPSLHQVVMIDPVSQLNDRLHDYHLLTVGEDDAPSISELITSGDIILGNTDIGASVQRNVMPVSARWR